MTWTKLGDEFADTAFDLTDAAFRLHVEALIYSNRRLLDHEIPKSQVRRLTAVEDFDTAAKELVESGWWEDHGDTWFTGCRFPHWQLESGQVEHKRDENALRQRRKRKHDIGDHSLCLPSKNCKDATRDSPEEPSRRDGTP